MLYKRVSTALCLAVFLSVTPMQSTDINLSDPSNLSKPSINFTFEKAKDMVLSYTDWVADYIGFKDTMSLAKVSVFLLVVIPLIKYLTDGKKFDKASSDEELVKALEIFKNKKSIRSLKLLSTELWYKLVRIVRSKSGLGHRSYLITVKKQKSINQDGSEVEMSELKKVPATGLCKYIEEMGEHITFVINSTMGLGVVKTIAEAIDKRNLVEGTKSINYKLASNH